MRKLFVIAFFTLWLSNILDGPGKLSNLVIKQDFPASYAASGHHRKHVPALVQSQVSISNYCCRSTARAQIGYTAYTDSANTFLQNLPLTLSSGFGESVLKPPCFILA